MTFVSRVIQTVATGKMDEKIEIEKRFQAAEERVGNAAVRHYKCNFGADSQWTYIKEWEYDDFASWQEIYERAHADPAYAEVEALQAEDEEKGITIDQRNEIYTLLDV